jgi:hypothetical protein
VQEEPPLGVMGILIDVVDPAGVECGRPPDEAVDFVPVGQQELGQVRAVKNEA